MGRIGIFTSSINKFLVNLKRGHKELFDTVDKGIIEKYLSEKSLECFSMVKPSESAKTLASVSADLFDLVQQFKDHPEVKAMQLLCEFPVGEMAPFFNDDFGRPTKVLFEIAPPRNDPVVLGVWGSKNSWDQKDRSAYGL